MNREADGKSTSRDYLTENKLHIEQAKEDFDLSLKPPSKEETKADIRKERSKTRKQALM